MNRTIMIIYKQSKELLQQEDLENEQKEQKQYPNAFIVNFNKQITVNKIRSILPWDRIGKHNNKILRFGMKIGSETLWLDLKGQEQVPLYTQTSIFIKIC